jgi:hypothetical protein
VLSTANTLTAAYVLACESLLAYLLIVALKITRLKHKLGELRLPDVRSL